MLCPTEIEREPITHAKHHLPAAPAETNTINVNKEMKSVVDGID